MGWLEGLLGGITERKSELEALNLREAELSAQREANVYQALLGSDNPEIQAMAVSGLLDSAQPRKRKGGMRGWLGEMDQSPTFQRLQTFLQTPRAETVTEERETLPAKFGAGGTVTPTVEQAPTTAAMPLTSAVAPSAPPPMPMSYTQAPPTPYTVQSTVMRTPQIFLTPGQRAIQAAEAKGAGVGAEYTATYNAVYNAERRLGSSHEDAVAAARIAAGGTRAGAAGQTYAEGEIVADPTSRTGWSQTLYLRANPSITQKIPASAPMSRSSRAVNAVEQVAFDLFGRPGEDPRTVMTRLTPPEMNQVIARKQQLDAQGAELTTAAQGRARIQTELDSPIGTTAGIQYNLPPTTTLAQLAQTIGLTEEQKGRVYAISQMDQLVTDIERLIPAVFPNVPEGATGRIKTQLSLGIQMFSADSDLAKLDAAINAALAQVAQMTGQPGSRLSDTDLQLARSTLAQLTPSIFGGDTLNTAQARIQVIRNLLEKARGSVPASGPLLPPRTGGTGTTAPPPAPGAGTTGQPTLYQDADGKFRVKF